MIEYALVMFLLGPTAETTKIVHLADNVPNAAECQRMAQKLSFQAAWASRPNPPKQTYACLTIYPVVVEQGK